MSKVISTVDRVGLFINLKEKNMGRPKGSKNWNRPNGNQKVCGKTIYYHRLAHDMTQAEMAKKIGISARNLQRMENDPKFKTTKSTAYKVCYEIIFNPALANPEVIALVDKWNEGDNDK